MTRIAFLTDEFVTEAHHGGGLSTYIDRMARALVENGVEVEVFVKSGRFGCSVIDHDGVRVTRVGTFHPVYSAITFVTELVHVRPLGGNGALFAVAKKLASAVITRHHERPFDMVQATNNSATGLFLPRHAGFRHVVRLSAHRRTWREADGRPRAPWLEALERRAVRRADVAYAPSQYLADLYARDCRDDVKVVRPPAYLEVPESTGLQGVELPPRYFVHFGQLGLRKGSMALARALPLVWKEVPDFAMVWAGRVLNQRALDRETAAWGKHSGKVLQLGLMKKDALYTVVRRAEASVLPSLADSLPNTVIESLVLGVPVIGFRDASLPELIDEGIHGLLAEPGRVEDLAAALVRGWREGAGAGKGKFPPPKIFDEMQPARAVENLLELAGLNQGR